ncbi:MAG: hypothetical protein BWZ11_00141 [Bacteroidetes bacterium ADurb.BinA395]|nr:MAG: hypothetical protein BWZ11_00141 [Bacteroidetes bacterium ADurb.BinA395]
MKNRCFTVEGMVELGVLSFEFRVQSKNLINYLIISE